MKTTDDKRILAAIQPDPEPKPDHNAAAGKMVEPEPVAWVDVKGFEESYEVSNEGDLRSKKTGKILAKHLAGSGYVKAEMWKNGERHQTYIHRLVADAFVLGDGDEVNHKNGIKTDNRSSNLEWCTRSENVKHGYYTLGYRIQAVTATNPETGEVRNYRSVEESVRDGFDSANVYRAINNPGRRVKGFLFEKATPSSAGTVSVEEAREPDYCYDPDDWEFTYPWETACEMEESLLYGPGKGNDHIARVCTLYSGPDKWVARIPLDTDGDGEADDWEVRWFDSKDAALRALAGDKT